MHPPSRNDQCPCGSGKKYKRCCGADKKSPILAAKPATLDANQLVQQALYRHQQGDLDSAIRLFDQALSIRPKESILHGLRGMVLLEKGDTVAAMQGIQYGLTLAPRNSHLFNFLGQTLGRTGDPAGAEKAFKRAISIEPGLLEAWFNLGSTQLDEGRPEEAIVSYYEVVARSPNHGLSHIQLAKAFYLQRDLTNAEIHVRQALSLGITPGRSGLWLAQILSAQGKHAESIEQEKKTLEQIAQPAEAFSIFNELADAELLVGRFEAAEAWLIKAIARFPDKPEPYCKLSKTRKFTNEDSDLLAKMESLLSTASFNEKRELEFSIGKIYADQGNPDNAFRHYKAANDLVRGKVAPNLQAYEFEADRLIKLFTAESIARLPIGNPSDLPILVIGPPRSGTTLVETLLCGHSKVSGAGESMFWSDIGQSVISRLPDHYSQDDAQNIGLKYLAHLQQHSSTAQHVVDKMPANFWYLGLIHAILPNAKIIHCIRNPVDTCLSLYFQNLSDAHTYKWDLESLAAWYRQYRRLMAHWRAVLPPGTIYDLKYENLVDDTESESRKLLEFLGLEWESSILEFHNRESTVFTASKWQVRQRVYTSSKERWRRYEKHIGPLLALLEE